MKTKPLTKKEQEKAMRRALTILRRVSYSDSTPEFDSVHDPDGPVTPAFAVGYVTATLARALGEIS